MSSYDNTKVLLIDTSEFVVLYNRMNGANGIDGFDEIKKIGWRRLDEMNEWLMAVSTY